jgi:hypothetical protein
MHHENRRRVVWALVDIVNAQRAALRIGNIGVVRREGVVSEIVEPLVGRPEYLQVDLLASVFWASEFWAIVSKPRGYVGPGCSSTVGAQVEM